MYSSSKQPFGALYTTIIFITCAIALALIFYTKEAKEDKERGFFKGSTSTLDIAYKASMQKYKLLAKNIFTHEIQKDKILELFNKGAKSKGAEQNLYRGLLYRELSPLYEKLKIQGIRQLHFHLKNGDSFLRFHKPSKSGDNLFDSRQSVKITNSKHVHVDGFETGKVVSGFRNVFPVRYKNSYIGSVEISLTAKVIIETLSSLDKHREFNILVKKDLIDSKIFKTQKFLYSISSINKNYLQEDAHQYLKDSPKPLSDIAIKINKKLHFNIDLHKAMKNGDIYGTFIKIENNDYEVSFLPMIGLENQLEGYLISYRKVLSSPLIIKYFIYFPIVIIIITIVFIRLIFIIKEKTNYLNSQKIWFNSVTDTLTEGLYVMDIKGIIEYINPKACQILGYTKEELIDKCAHSMFHSHYINHHLPQQDCPIFRGAVDNKEFYSSEEFFTCKDGTVISVDIGSKSILKDTNTSQIVTVFKDITEKKKLENKMLLLTKALEASSNTVVITDIDANIQWANPAFIELTGYEIKQVVGKNPKEFINSGKQTVEFYEELWKTILDKRSWKGELINKKKDGNFYHEELSITPVLNENDEIQNFIAIKQDISDRKKAEEHVKHFAFYDALTDLPNRRLLIEYLEQIINKIERIPKCVALLFLDLDKFKVLNDTHGHDAGDYLLVQVAQRLQSVIRKQDIVARIGGDEFIIVLDDLPQDIDIARAQTKMISEKIKDTLKIPFELKKISYQLTTSIGAFVFNNHNSNITTILKKADLALYAAKNHGRDNISFYKDLTNKDKTF